MGRFATCSLNSLGVLGSSVLVASGNAPGPCVQDWSVSRDRRFHARCHTESVTRDNEVYLLTTQNVTMSVKDKNMSREGQKYFSIWI